MKTRLTQIILATFLLAFLTVGNVSAKGSELAIASCLENITELKLEVEDWMLNENNWNNFDNTTFVVADFSEEYLALEDWMLNENNWINKRYQYPDNETEQNLMLEDWMINEVYWN